MDPVVVVGSGASGVHFALSLLEKGRRVTMIDVGRRRPEPAFPTASFNALKSQLDDPVDYFLGASLEAVTLPGKEGELYRFPPSKDYVFVGADGFEQAAAVTSERAIQLLSMFGLYGRMMPRRESAEITEKCKHGDAEPRRTHGERPAVRPRPAQPAACRV